MWKWKKRKKIKQIWIRSSNCNYLREKYGKIYTSWHFVCGAKLWCFVESLWNFDCTWKWKWFWVKVTLKFFSVAFCTWVGPCDIKRFIWQSLIAGEFKKVSWDSISVNFDFYFPFKMYRLPLGRLILPMKRCFDS